MYFIDALASLEVSLTRRMIFFGIASSAVFLMINLSQRICYIGGLHFKPYRMHLYYLVL